MSTLLLLSGGVDSLVVAETFRRTGHRFAAVFFDTLRCLPELLTVGPPILIGVQNGMEPSDLPRLGPALGLFIGGDTQWKERSAATWAAYARGLDARCHMARVNTARRIHLAAAAGCTSFDGTSGSRFAVTVPPLTNARRTVFFQW